MSALPPSLVQVLYHRGYKTPESIQQLLEPAIPRDAFPIPELSKAVNRLRPIIDAEGPVAIYADRDVDGLTGLAILARSLKTLGAQVHWGSPLNGRGLQRDVLASLVRTGAKVMILVDCGTGERPSWPGSPTGHRCHRGRPSPDARRRSAGVRLDYLGALLRPLIANLPAAVSWRLSWPKASGGAEHRSLRIRRASIISSTAIWISSR